MNVRMICTKCPFETIGELEASTVIFVAHMDVDPDNHLDSDTVLVEDLDREKYDN